MGASSSKRGVKTEVRPKLDLPWIVQTSGTSGSNSGPETPTATAMAEKSDDVFENACYIFVVFGASVSYVVCYLNLWVAWSIYTDCSIPEFEYE